MPSDVSAPSEDFFNDLSRNPSGSDKAASPTTNNGGHNAHSNGNTEIPKTKRIACVLCRKRKLKCDGEKPACGTCSRLGHDCTYDEQRKKSGPKRGYVKLLEQRLKQVENLLGTKGNETSPVHVGQTPIEPPQQDFQQGMDTRGPETIMDPFMNAGFDGSTMDMMPDLQMNGAEEFSWELLSLGLDEPLPGQDIIDDLNSIYWEKIHPSHPMIHRPRFLASMDLAPPMRPPIALRYAMWTHVCSVTPRYAQLQDHFYARARKYAQADEMKGHGESLITLGHCQAWSLLAAFEFKMMYFPRAWMSCGRAARLAQMMGLHRLDGAGLDVKQCLPPPRDWTEREERRRTFWMTFCNDRYASVGTGWPMTIDEQDILTNLPATEESYNKSRPETTTSLSEAMTGDGASQLSPFAGVILMATLFGRNLTHLHRPTPEDRDHDLNGEFWKRHRALDNILLNTSLSMPNQLRLPAGMYSANIVFLNMNLHTSTICLHQAAIFKSDKNRMATQISAESKRRCIIAADQITNIMKMISHVDLSTLNPFMAFCLYVAARVFVQYLKSRKDDVTVKNSLLFLLSAMQALKAKNPLTESFLVQLDVDLEGSGLDISADLSRNANGSQKLSTEVHVNTDSIHCSPLFDIHESQSPDTARNGQPPPPLVANNDVPIDFAVQNFTSPDVGGMGYFTQDPSRMQIPERTRSTAPQAANANYAQNSSLSDFGLSPDGSIQQPSSGRNSNHPTPSASTTSNKGSSNTSFTPPQFDDGSTTYAAFNTLSPNTTARIFDDYGQPLDANQNGPEGMNTPFAMAAGWDFSADGAANSGTGMKENNPENYSAGIPAIRSGLTPFMSSDGGLQSMHDTMNAAKKNSKTTQAEWMFTTGWNNGTA